MLIDETFYPVETAWDGELVQLSGVFAPRGQAMPRVSIGNPVWWPDRKILGEGWTPPAGGKRYGLARFAFSLSPQGRQEVQKAELMVDFQPVDGGSKPVAFDLVPRAEKEERTGSFTFGIGPDLKFGDVDVSLAKAETTINMNWAFPVIAAYGIGESTARWVFTARPAHPLVGSQVVYAIVELPAEVSAAKVSLYLSAEMATAIGPIKGLLPKEETADLSWVLT